MAVMMQLLIELMGSLREMMALVLIMKHTGAITGNILKLITGNQSIPQSWKEKLVGEEILKQVAVDLYVKVKGSEYSPESGWKERYPAG